MVEAAEVADPHLHLQQAPEEAAIAQVHTQVKILKKSGFPHGVRKLIILTLNLLQQEEGAELAAVEPTQAKKRKRSSSFRPRNLRNPK